MINVRQLLGSTLQSLLLSEDQDENLRIAAIAKVYSLIPDWKTEDPSLAAELEYAILESTHGG